MEIGQLLKKLNIELPCCAVLCSVIQSCLTLCDPIDCSLPGSSVHGVFQARILELPYNLAILLLVIYPRELKTYVHAKLCTSVFIAVLFLIFKKLKQIKCSSLDVWVYKMFYIYRMRYYWTMKWNEFWYMLQHESTLKTLGKHKRIQIVSSIYRKCTEQENP